MDSRTAVFEGQHGSTLKYGMFLKHVVVFMFDAAITIIIINLFDIHSEWGWLIVYLAVILIGYVKSFFQYVGTSAAFRFALKGLLEAEIKENIDKYHSFIEYNQYHISNYDVFLQAVASSEQLPVVERIRAAVSLGMLKQNMVLDSGYEKKVRTIFSPLFREKFSADT